MSLRRGAVLGIWISGATYAHEHTYTNSPVPTRARKQETIDWLVQHMPTINRRLIGWLQILDCIEQTERNPLAPVRMPIVDKWKDMGTIIMGKLENGFVRVGDMLQIMPNK